MKRFPLAIFGVLLLLTSSCAHQNLFQRTDQEVVGLDSLLLEPVGLHCLAPDDKIAMSIWDHADLSIGSIYGIYNSNEVYGKWVLVNEDGSASFPKIGRIPVQGLTVKELEDTLTAHYGRFIVDPVISARILNREVTVLGEVREPGNFILEKERNTLAEVLGRAGGMNFYANKKNVQLIRNHREYRIDLTSLSLDQGHDLVLRDGDLVHIPARKGQTVDRKAPILIPVTSVITALVLVFSFRAN